MRAPLDGEALIGQNGNYDVPELHISSAQHGMEDTMPATPLQWCPDCQIYYAAHPFDHLSERHPPEYSDGSTTLPERTGEAA